MRIFPSKEAWRRWRREPLSNGTFVGMVLAYLLGSLGGRLLFLLLH